MSDAEKLSMIRAMCQHPGSFHWTGQGMARLLILQALLIVRKSRGRR